MADVTNTAGRLLPDDAEERLLKLFSDSPLNDEPLTEEQDAAVGRLMARLRDEPDEPEPALPV